MHTADLLWDAALSKFDKAQHLTPEIAVMNYNVINSCALLHEQGEEDLGVPQPCASPPRSGDSVAPRLDGQKAAQFLRAAERNRRL